MKKASTLSLPGKQSICPNSPMAKRTKQEVRMAQKVSFIFVEILNFREIVLGN